MTSLKGHPQVLEALNRALRMELAAINQYVLHARMMDHWGLVKRGRKEMREARVEMDHADRLIQRILMLDGEPRLDPPERLQIGRDLKSAIEGDLALEREAVSYYREVVALCERERDYVSRDLMRALLADEEEHAHHLETELELIASIGLARYTQSMLGDFPLEE